MENHVIDALVAFTGMFAAVLCAIGMTAWWMRRRLRIIRARLITRVAAGEFSLGSLIAAIRINRHAVTTAQVRRRLTEDVAGAVRAVGAAERAGAPIGDLGMLCAELETAATALDNAIVQVAPSGVSPVLLARAGELGISAHRLRAAAEKLLAHATVPDHGALVDAISAVDPPTARAPFLRGLLPH